jgi:hypothetical protein
VFTEKDLELGKMVTICRSAEQAHEQVQKMTVESRDGAAVAAKNANGRKFGQGQMDEQRMSKPQNTEKQRQRARPRHEKTEEIYCIVDMPQRMANDRVQHLANYVEDVVRMVISARTARSKARKVNNQE